MPKALRVLVLGSGFAGQGHAEAFRNAGVEIIGMVSRTLSVTQQVAKEIGAARETVCRWRKNNPAFIAVLNQRRMAIWHASKDRMRRNIALALDVLETALKAGDVRVALEFVKRVDKDVPPIGPETIEGVLDEMARDQAFQGYRSSGHAQTVEALRYDMGFGCR